MRTDVINNAMKLQLEMIHLFHKNFAGVFHKMGGGPMELNKNQKKAILLIGKKEKVMPSELGKCLDLQKGSLTSLIDALEHYELVEREGDPEDRRKTLVSLTKSGEAYRIWITGQIEKNSSEILEKLNEEELERYQNSLKTLIEIFGKIEERS